MKTKLVDVNETRKNLKVEIPQDVVDAEIARVSERYGKSVRLPGFRPGKIPGRVIRQRFKREILHDVAHELIERAVIDALTERGVEPVASPDIRDVVVAEGQPLTFKAEFDVLPLFDPGELGSIEVRRPPVVIDDETVDQALERLRERAARFEPVEEGVVGEGHTLVLDLERQPHDRDGRPGERTRHAGIAIDMGAPANPPGFDAELVGMTTGETRSFRVRYPEDHPDADLAGTEVAFTVMLQGIRTRVVPALDDEFAKDLGDLEDLAGLRARVRQDLEAEAREASDRQVRADVLKQLATRVPFPVPESLVAREADRRVEELARRLVDQRIDPRKTNIDWTEFRAAQRGPAAEAVASALVLDEIARRDDVRVSEAEIDAELERAAARAGLTVPAVRAHLEQDGGLERVAAGLRRDKTLARVLDQVRIVDV